MEHIPTVKRACLVCLSFIVSGFPSLGLAESEAVTVVDKQGHATSASLVSSNGVTLTFARNADKRQFTVPLAGLSDATQDLVRDWVKAGGSLVEKFEVVVETAKNARKKGGEDFDDKRVNLTPSITIKNIDPNFQSRAAKVTVVFLGRPVDSMTDLHVLRAQTFDLPQLLPLTCSNFDMAEISQAYDNRGYAKFGSRYLGYVVLIHDGATKKLYDARSVPPSLAATLGAKFIAVKTGQTYDHDLKPLVK